MRFELEVSLDPTLGCGQAHRWIRKDDGWEGVVGNDIVTLRQTEYGFDAEGCSDRRRLLDYFRPEDDLGSILKELSDRDARIASLASACPGLRILKQPEWECLATYLLATNANVKRIGKMVESVCDTFGTDLGGRRSFPEPKQILDRRQEIRDCKLGFREQRFIELAERVENGDLDVEAIGEMDYEDCVKALMGINGVGPKVADCVALFGYGHLEAFPVDVRIQKAMESEYGVTGSYKAVSSAGRGMFGRYAGYAQELLYHSERIPSDPPQRTGGYTPV